MLSHEFFEIGLPMNLSVYMPPQAAYSRVPVLLYLAGPTSDEGTFLTRAGAQSIAANPVLALIVPGTNPDRLGILGYSVGGTALSAWPSVTRAIPLRFGVRCCLLANQKPVG